MPIYVRKHTATRGNKTITVGAYTKSGEKTVFRKYELKAMNEGANYIPPKSSCIREVRRTAEGGLMINIRGREYPYPNAGQWEMNGLVQARSTGGYYNRFIKERISHTKNR